MEKKKYYQETNYYTNLCVVTLQTILSYMISYSFVVVFALSIIFFPLCSTTQTEETEEPTTS